MGFLLLILFVVTWGLLVRSVYIKNIHNISLLSTLNSATFCILILYWIFLSTTSLIVGILALIPIWLLYRIFKMPLVLLCVSYISAKINKN